MPRLFSGITLPDHIIMQLALLQCGLKNARWIDPFDFHITLRFLGDVDDEIAAEYTALLEQIEFQPFMLKLKGVGSFGGRKPRIIYAGVEKSEALLDLQGQHEQAAVSLGLDPDRRTYAPHVTLLRPRNIAAGKVAQYLQYQGMFESHSCMAQSFQLFSARPGYGGGPYLIEESYPKISGQDSEDGRAYQKGTDELL